MEHTKGPWKVWKCEHGMGSGRTYVEDSTEIIVAHMEQENYADLVAAAPELLDIAKAYRNLLKTLAHTDGEVATYHHIENVLAKAEGNK